MTAQEDDVLGVFSSQTKQASPATSSEVMGMYTKGAPQIPGKVKSLVTNRRSFIKGGVNKGTPAYLLKDDQWADCWNFVFDYDRARMLAPLKTVDSFVATPSMLQPGTPSNRTLVPVIPPAVSRSGQQPRSGYQYYPAVPVYDHSQGPNPEPVFDPLDPYQTQGGFLPIVQGGTIGATNSIATLYTIIASGNPFRFSATGLPAGLVINTLTGVISGNVSVGFVTAVDVTITAENVYGVGIGTLVIKPGLVFSTGIPFETNPSSYQIAIDDGDYGLALTNSTGAPILSVAGYRMRFKTTVVGYSGGFSQCNCTLPAGMVLLAGSKLSVKATVTSSLPQTTNRIVGAVAQIPAGTGNLSNTVDISGITVGASDANEHLIQSGGVATNIIFESLFIF